MSAQSRTTSASPSTTGEPYHADGRYVCLPGGTTLCECHSPDPHPGREEREARRTARQLASILNRAYERHEAIRREVQELLRGQLADPERRHREGAL